jgi:hypothetical protein
VAVATVSVATAQLAYELWLLPAIAMEPIVTVLRCHGFLARLAGILNPNQMLRSLLPQLTSPQFSFFIMCFVDNPWMTSGS